MKSVTFLSYGLWVMNDIISINQSHLWLEMYFIVKTFHSMQATSAIDQHFRENFLLGPMVNAQSAYDNNCLEPASPISNSAGTPQICEFCGFETRNSCHMKRHYLSHTGSKPYICPVCPHKCNQKANLKTHMLSHMNLKQFKCSFCEFRSNLKGNVKKHEIRLHSDSLTAS